MLRNADDGRNAKQDCNCRLSTHTSSDARTIVPLPLESVNSRHGLADSRLQDFGMPSFL
jgi:hypothetical protein